MSRKISEFAREVSRIVPNIWREVTRRQMRHSVWGKMSLPQMLILEILSHRPHCIMCDLAESLSVSTPAVTGLVDRMVKGGYVRRVRDQKDRRVINIELTSKGITAAKGVSTTRRKMIEELFGRLTSAERETYLGILRKVFEGIKKTGKKVKKR